MTTGGREDSHGEGGFCEEGLEIGKVFGGQWLGAVCRENRGPGGCGGGFIVVVVVL